MSSFLEDRSWMYIRRDPNSSGLNPVYVEGVAVFIKFACDRLGNTEQIRCPCKKCVLRTVDTSSNVHYHLLRWGFMAGYVVWDRHGELEEPVSRSISMPEVNPYSTMVMDAAGPSFNWNTDIPMEENPNPEAARFYQLLRDAEQPLYPGCKQSRLEAVAKFLSLKSGAKMADGSFNQLLKLVNSILPEDAILSENYYQTRKLVAALGLAYIKIDACSNDCILYYAEYENFDYCPICGHSRYKPGKEKTARRNGVPNKRLRYFPITPRLQRLYMSTKTASHMTWHKRNKSNDGEMVHPSDGDSWKHFERTYSSFSAEPRNVRLALASDGFDPFSASSAPYSCWPVFLTPYNLPPWMCMKLPYLYLTLLIPGYPGKNIDVYLRPLVDELNHLWEHEILTYDAARKQNFMMKAALMWTIGDFPAYGMLSGWSTHGPKSCPHCMGYSKAFMLHNGKKPCFFDCHRRFLPLGHPLRRNRDSFRKGRVEKDPPPPVISGDELNALVSSLPDIIHGPSINAQKIPEFGKDHNWTQRSIFWELPYWHSHLLCHMIDMMHTEKNNFDNLFNTVLMFMANPKTT